MACAPVPTVTLKIFSVFLRYRSHGETRIASRAVAAADQRGAISKLLEHVRTRPGYCVVCKRYSEQNHRPASRDVQACPETSWQSEADAELVNNGRAAYASDDLEPQPPVTLEINGQKFGPYEQPYNKSNPQVLR